VTLDPMSDVLVPGFKTALRRCPLCSTAGVEVLHTQRFQMPGGSPLPDVYDVVACPGCGLVYADTPAPQQAYDRYYAEFSRYEDPAVATGGGGSALDQVRLEALADSLATQTDRSARILDIGCAGGGLLAALRRKGFERLYGSDASAECVAQVASMGIPAQRASLSELDALERSGPFDLVVLSHVLEHVPDLRPVMSAVAKLVTEKGAVYAETPDAARYNDFAHVPFYFFDPEHINHFDVERLAILGRSAGFVAEGSGAKTLKVGPDKTYPACWIWLRSRGGAPYTTSLVGSRELRDRMAEYVRRCRDAGDFPELKSLAEAGTPVVVWGAGSFALRLFGAGALDACPVVAVVDRDRNKQGRPFAGFTVEPPEAALERNPDAVVLVVAAICGDDIAAEARAIRGGGRVVTLSRPVPEPL